METDVKNVNKDIIGVILVGIVLIMGVYIFTSLADIGGTTEYFSSSENSTMNTSSVFVAPVSDGVSSFSAKVYNQTWLNFDGTTKNVTTLNNINGLVDDNNSISVYIRFSQVNQTSAMTLFSKGSTYGSSLSFQITTLGGLRVFGANSTGTADRININSAPVLSGINSSLQSILFKYNGTFFSYYLNGYYIGRSTFTEGFNGIPKKGYVGVGWDGTSKLNGSIDSIFVFNRTLSDFEQYNLYKSNSLYYNYSISYTNLSTYLEEVIPINSTLLFGETGFLFRKSIDGGNSWTTIYNGADTNFLFKSSNNNIYFLNNNSSILTIYNFSTNSFLNVSNVFDLGQDGNYCNVLGSKSMTETTNGSLLLGEYGTNCSIIKMSSDGGLNWNVVYNSSTRVGSIGAHIHFVQCDNYHPNICYASEGDSGSGSGHNVSRILKSTNNGATWSDLFSTGPTNSTGQPTTVVFTPTTRIFGLDTGIYPGILITNDDLSFTQTLNLSGTIKGWAWASSYDPTTNNAYISFLSLDATNYSSSIFYSNDNGINWYGIYNYDCSGTTYAGVKYISSFDELGNAYFSNSKNNKLYKFNRTVFNNFDTTSVLAYNLDENSGTTAYDSSGNGNNGTISGATWQNDGVLVPLTENTDYSISNNGLLSLLNSNYLYSYIVKYWTYFTESTNPGTVASLVMVDSLGNSTTFLSILIVISFAVVILTLFKPSVNTNPLGKPHY